MLISCFFRHLIVALSLILSFSLSGQSSWDDQQLATEFDSLRQLAEALPKDSVVRQSLLLHEAGKIADEASDLPAAIMATKRALDLRLENEALTGEGVLLSAMNLGIYYNKLDQYDQALSYFGLIINRAPNRKEGEAWYQMARSYSSTGEFSAGEKAFMRAAQLPPFSSSDYLSAYLQQQLGVLHLNKNNASGGSAAIPPLTNALNYFVSDGDQYGEMATLIYLGWAFTNSGDYSEAITQLEEALRLAPLVDAYDDDYSAIYSNLGIAHRRQGELQKALTYYRKAVSIQLAAGDDTEEIHETYSGLSTAFKEFGTPDSAIYYAQRALVAVIPNFAPTSVIDLPEIALINGHRLAIITYLTDLALALEAAGDAPAALAAFRRADELLDAMRLRQLLEDTRNYWRADARGLYDQAIATALEADDAGALFYFVEKARGRLLLDELSANRAADLLPPKVQEQLATSTRQVRLYPDRPALTDRFRQLQDSILKAFPEYAQQRIGSPPPSVQDLPSILGNRQLVEYYVSGQHTLALTYTKGQGLKVTQLAAPSIWEPLLWEYRKQLTNPRSTITPSLPLDLHRHLIAPLNINPEAELIIIPDGELYLLPFGALLSDTPDTKATMQQWPWLAGKHKIGYAFSAQLLDRARQQRGRGNGRVLAVAPVSRITPKDQLLQQLELPATLRTARHLANILPTDTLINEQATQGAFRQMADAYSVVNLGTHAYLEDGGSFLLRGGNNNRYTGNDLLEHRLNADLVVIGACETGLGKQLVGEGIASLGRGFARRGASGLIMSLWSIDDASTADLLNQTYTSLASGQGPASALRVAGATYRKNSTNPRFSHPYFWAGLVHYGRDETLPMVSSNVPWWKLLLAGAVVLIIGLFWLRRK